MAKPVRLKFWILIRNSHCTYATAQFSGRFSFTTFKLLKAKQSLFKNSSGNKIKLAAYSFSEQFSHGREIAVSQKKESWQGFSMIVVSLDLVLQLQ